MLNLAWTRPGARTNETRTRGRGARERGGFSPSRVRDPAPPLFGPGFGAREPGEPCFRWAGPAAHGCSVPADQGPAPAPCCRARRPGTRAETTLRVTEGGFGTGCSSSTGSGRVRSDLADVRARYLRADAGALGVRAFPATSRKLPPLDGAKPARERLFRRLREATGHSRRRRSWAEGRSPGSSPTSAPPDDGRFATRRASSRARRSRTRGSICAGPPTSIVFSPRAGFVRHVSVLRARAVARPSTSPCQSATRRPAPVPSRRWLQTQRPARPRGSGACPAVVSACRRRRRMPAGETTRVRSGSAWTRFSLE